MTQFRFWLVVILVITLISVWIDLPNNSGLHIDFNGDGEDDISADFKVVQGLDLQGGSRVLLKSAIGDVGEDEISVARDIIERRVNGLGLSEAVVQTQGGSRIIVELPGVSDRDLALSTVQETGLLEFVDFANLSFTPGEGDCIITTEQQRIAQERAAAEAAESQQNQSAPPPTSAPTLETQIIGKYAPPSQTPRPSQDDNGNAKCANGQPVGQNGQPDGTPFRTVMTGSGLDDAAAVIDPNGTRWQVNFVLTSEGSDVFQAHTAANVGQQMAIVLDGVVLSAPVINQAISGSGVIQGSFTSDEARSLAVQLRYGALPVPLEVEAYDQIGPTLGEISINRSIRAGVIGVIVVLLFMMIYYRVPGIAATLALLVFTAINFAFYKALPVTLTLPAITGFLISIGTAVDGNILIFERMKEELRDGKKLDKAVELGFSRAWTSIIDSNLSTGIVCAILFFFGRTFGASAVQGFAITLGLGLAINLFTAMIVTRTWLTLFMNLFGKTLSNNDKLMGA
ncbi:MAG: protein translocase subunit SecD [Anaerolineales bacterium]|nr:protein translocase subunit SecD [Anaerolineales bacterium]